jgi:phasin family protein
MDPKNPFAHFEAEMKKMMGDFKMPGIDVNSLMESQRRNMEALTEANKLSLEAMQAIAKRQSEVLNQFAEELNRTVREMMTGGSPETKMARQAEIAKDGYERTVAHMREMGEMIQRANTEAFNVLNQRFSASLDEVRGVLDKKKSR